MLKNYSCSAEATMSNKVDKEIDKGIIDEQYKSGEISSESYREKMK